MLTTEKRGVCIIITKSLSTLLAMRTKPTDPFVGRFTPPGGSVESGETYREAAVREMKEETGLQVDPLRLDFLGEDLREKPNGEEYALATFHLKLKENEQLQWMERDRHSDWIAITVPYARQMENLMPGVSAYLAHIEERSF